MIHILRGGFAICGKPDVPGFWRDDDRWVHAENADHADCAECVYALIGGTPMARKSQPPPLNFEPAPEPTPAPKPPVKAKPAPATAPESTLRVAGCELQSAPEHALLVKLTGEAEELRVMRQKIQRALHPDDGSEPGRLPPDLSSTLPRG